MKKILSACLSLILLVLLQRPADSISYEPFLAVFAYPGQHFEWVKFNPDLYKESVSWGELDEFLDEAKLMAGNRPLIVDIDCHGDCSSGLLFLENNTGQFSMASVGYLVNHIENKIEDKYTEVTLEACYSQICMERTLFNNVPVRVNNIYVENHFSDIKFPIYGVGRSVNYNNLIYMQHHYGIHQFFKDLRKYRGKPPETPDDSKETDLSLRSLEALLRVYGN